MATEPGCYSGATWLGMACKPTCSAASDRVMCESDQSVCDPLGKTCIESLAAPGYYWCS